MKSINEIVKQLDLEAHPEGGFFKETYRSTGEVDTSSLPENYQSNRNYSTCIYFLLTSENFSAFHRIKQDEIWHFYKGSPISLHIISREGNYEKHMIGSNLERGEVPQFVVRGGDWFASEVETPERYALAGCTVSPGFDFEDFDLAKRDKMLFDYPEFGEVINRLTRI